MMYGYAGGFGGWGFPLMAVGMVLFWAVVIAGVVVLVRHGRQADPRLPASARPPEPGPERLLAERFARGEIDENEYYQRLTALRGAGPAAPR